MSLLYWGGGQKRIQDSRSHQCWVEQKNSISWPPGKILPNVARDTFFFNSKGILITHVQLGVYQDFQVLFCRGVFQTDCPQYALMPEVVSSQVKVSVLLFVELHEILPRSLWMTVWPSGESATTPSFVLSAIYWGCALAYNWTIVPVTRKQYSL